MSRETCGRAECTDPECKGCPIDGTLRVEEITTSHGEIPIGAAAEWIKKSPPLFKIGDQVRFGRFPDTVRIVVAIEIRQKIGAITGNFIKAYEYYVRTPGLSGVEESFIGVQP